MLDRLANHEAVSYELQVTGSQGSDETTITFVPRDFAECDLPPLLRPKFLPIVASNTLALALLRKANGRIDGFVVEGSTAGGHNAPPRGKPEQTSAGEPIYGERDKVDLRKMRELGLPFWLREPFRTAAGTIDYRCAAQPVSIYLSKGGKIEDTVGRICLCNALVANVGHPQVHVGKYIETVLVTSGDDLSEIPSFLPPDTPDYTAADVIAKLLDA